MEKSPPLGQLPPWPLKDRPAGWRLCPPHRQQAELAGRAAATPAQLREHLCRPREGPASVLGPHHPDRHTCVPRRSPCPQELVWAQRAQNAGSPGPQRWVLSQPQRLRAKGSVGQVHASDGPRLLMRKHFMATGRREPAGLWFGESEGGLGGATSKGDAGGWARQPGAVPLPGRTHLWLWAACPRAPAKQSPSLGSFPNPRSSSRL